MAVSELVAESRGLSSHKVV
ncbi:uncharacterized protein G2W53_002591 [Senna tora]|uniref:Uncharacterized protein n=1 Tax=Senna tora TaxID=362788 RepID=A0A834X7J4_9FABA|nr:uncharacterized protein G2W53_002591 [Senna tora]